MPVSRLNTTVRSTATAVGIKARETVVSVLLVLWCIVSLSVSAFTSASTGVAASLGTRASFDPPAATAPAGIEHLDFHGLPLELELDPVTAHTPRPSRRSHSHPRQRIDHRRTARGHRAHPQWRGSDPVAWVKKDIARGRVAWQFCRACRVAWLCDDFRRDLPVLVGSLVASMARARPWKAPNVATPPRLCPSRSAPATTLGGRATSQPSHHKQREPGIAGPVVVQGRDHG